ncbi:MAG TPA: hypothetical protein VNQ76_21245 [Planctomicrobium sp.]|nr:hypothetical protein [Planctomicrobium sp.]
MISPISTRTVPRFQVSTQPRLGWSEVALRCRADIPRAVDEVMGSMEAQPFSVTDGFAVQQSTREALETLFTQFRIALGDTVWLRFVVSPESVWIEIEAPHSHSETTPPDEPVLLGSELSGPRGALIKSFMTSVEYRDQGRRVLLTRSRGRGAAINGPPPGYDFQI